LLRVVLATFALGALIFALNSRSTMYEMVQDSSGVTMVSCLVPLVAGLYWKRANIPGAVLSVVLGLAVWGGAELLDPDALLPPLLGGLLASIVGMLIGTYAGVPGRGKADMHHVRPARHAGSAPAAHAGREDPAGRGPRLPRN